MTHPAKDEMPEVKINVSAINTAVNALKECAEQFRFYEQNHRAKSGHAKADINANYAARCENALRVLGFDLQWHDGNLELYSPIRADKAAAQSGGDDRAALEMLYREAKAVADDHHRPRYARLDQALASVEALLAGKGAG